MYIILTRAGVSTAYFQTVDNSICVNAFFRLRSVFTQRRTVAKKVGCFQRRLFVCLFVNTITSERVNIGWWNLRGRCIVQKSRPSSNFGGHSPWVRTPPPNVALGYDVGKISAGCLVCLSLHRAVKLCLVIKACRVTVSQQTLQNSTNEQRTIMSIRHLLFHLVKQWRTRHTEVIHSQLLVTYGYYFSRTELSSWVHAVSSVTRVCLICQQQQQHHNIT